MSNTSEEINNFRKWAVTAPRRTGEWETEYPDWDNIYHSVFQDLNNGKITSSMFADLIYIIGRDNEDGFIIYDLVNYGRLFLDISEASFTSSEYDAQWQFAANLPRIQGYQSQVINMLLRYYESENEYVKRRAIYSLSAIHYSEIESLAVRSWNTGIDPQRQATLQVLFDCKSNKLKHYMRLAEKEEGGHVKYTLEILKRHFA